MFLANNKPTRFYLRDLPDVLRTDDSWSGRLNITHQLGGDIEWWAAVPTHIVKADPSTSMSRLSTCMSTTPATGVGTVLCKTIEARGLWYITTTVLGLPP